MKYEAVITGLGPVAPNGVGKEAFWEAIKSGKSGIRTIKKFSAEQFPCQIAGEVLPEWLEAYDSELPDWLPDSQACRFSLIGTMMALDDAGLSREEVGQSNSAIFMGVTTTDMEVILREYATYLDTGMTRPDTLISSLPHIPAVIISHLFKSYDKVLTISTTCTSGINGIIFGAESIARGESDLVIAGGVDTPLTPQVLSSFCSAGMVPDAYNERPDEASRPFEENRKGGVLSEGAGIVIIEEKKRAERRKANIYALVSGGGLATAMSPGWMKKTMIKAMKGALESSSLKPKDIDLISACAPGDPIIDLAETEAIKALFSDYAYNIPITSIKSMIGNPGAAAGPLQAIAAALSIENKFIPPTINLLKPAKQCDLDYVSNFGRIARVKKVMINLRGFGGGFSSLILSQS